jgi:prepilin signal peptidase PulO-like enzyme (type II secretory pathway)
MINLFWFVIGIAAGSVGSALVYRLPRGVVWYKGRSICPNCKRTLSPLDLVPIFSFLFLRGKCRYCKQPISWRYLILEIVSGLIFLNFGFLGFLYWLMLIIAIMDWETMLVSDALVAIWGVWVVLSGGTSIWGGLVGLGTIGIIWAISKGKAMGSGDIGIAAVLGLWLGWPKIITGLWLAFVIGGIYGAYLLITKKAKLKTAIPFGPFLLIGGAIAYTYCYGLLCF